MNYDLDNLFNILKDEKNDEKELKQKSKSIRVKKYQEKKITTSLIANLIRQQISIKANQQIDRKVVYFHKPNFLDEFFSHPKLKQFTTQGPVTPDHVIRIKSKPLLIDLSDEKSLNLESKIIKAIQKYQEDYKKYFNKD